MKLTNNEKQMLIESLIQYELSYGKSHYLDNLKTKIDNIKGEEE